MNIRFLVFLQLRHQEVKQSLRALQEGAFTGEEKEELVHGAALGQVAGRGCTAENSYHPYTLTG